jgi:hypothetical protein
MMRHRHNFLADFTMNIPTAGMSFEYFLGHPFMALVATSHEMTHTGGSLGTVRLQMILLTGHILEKAMALSTFDRGAVRSTRGIGQTKGATMRTGCAVFFHMAVAHITVVTIVFVFRHTRHGEDRIIMLVVV